MLKFSITLAILIFSYNTSYSKEVRNLGYKKFLEIVLSNNSNILDSKLELEIANQEFLNIYQEYDAQLVSQVGIERNQTPYTAYEMQSTALLGSSDSSGLTFYGERNENFSVGVEKRIRTGGTFKISASVINLENTKQTGEFVDSERRGFLGASFTQPLLRGKGASSEIEVKLSISNMEKNVIVQSHRKNIIDTIREASNAYWSLYLAQEKLSIRRKSVALMKKILKDTQIKIENGYSARLENNSVTAALARRELQASEAEKFVSEQSSIASQLLLSKMGYSIISANDKLIFQRSKYSPQDSINKALKYNPNITSLKNKLIQEKIRIQYEKNKNLPQLDLNLSYGMNALRNNNVSISSNKHDSWYVGLEFSTPLNKKSLRGNEKVAKLREKRITNLLKSKEYEIRTRVLSIIQRLNIANKDIRKNETILRQEKHIHKAFSIEKKSGDRGLNSLIQQELELNRAKEDLITAKVSYHQLLISLWAEEGTLLSKFGLE